MQSLRFEKVYFILRHFRKGMRSERALICALAEMYIKGVSTRKVKAIAKEVCGVEISAEQVN